MPEEVKKEYPVKNEDMMSIWHDLNKGIVMSTEPLSLEEIDNLITYEN